MPRFDRHEQNHTLSTAEADALHKISNVLYDEVRNRFEMHEERADELTRFMIRAAEVWLEEGR